MKYLLIALVGILFFTQTAKAELTDADIKNFSNQYVETYKACDLNKIIDYIKTSYDPNYVARIRMPDGQIQNLSKQQFIKMTVQSIHAMVQMNAQTVNCTPDMDILKTDLNGDAGIIQIIQREKMTMQGANGKATDIRMNTICNHNIRKQNGQIIILQSACSVSQL